MNDKIKLQFVGKDNGKIKIIELALNSKPHYEIIPNYLKTSADDNVINFSQADETTINILNLSDNWQAEIEEVQDKLDLKKNPLLVFGPDNTKAMREAMLLGTEDYYTNSEQIAELDKKIIDIAKNLTLKKTESNEKNIIEKPQLVTTVINAEGGSGASFISSNIAHLFASQHKQHVALLDMDVQFGSQALNLDLNLKYGLSEVMESIDKLDSAALVGLFGKHKSGLHVLGEKMDEIVLTSELSPEKLDKLVNLSKTTFDHTVIDLPRQIDAMFAACVVQSSRVIIVMQQTVAHVRDTKRLITILIQEFEVQQKNISVMLNRYDERHAITIKDIEATIDHRSIIVMPNDYERSVKAVEAAKPFVEFAPDAPLAKTFKTVAQDLAGLPPKETAKPTFFKRAVAAIVGS